MGQKSKSSMWIVVVLGQLIGTLVVTYISSFIFPILTVPETNNWLASVIFSACFTVGVFLVGWLGFRLGWLPSSPRLILRLICSYASAFIILAIGILVFKKLEAGHPFFNLSDLAAIIGFYLPNWLKPGSTSQPA